MVKSSDTIYLDVLHEKDGFWIVDTRKEEYVDGPFWREADAWTKIAHWDRIEKEEREDPGAV